MCVCLLLRDSEKDREREEKKERLKGEMKKRECLRAAHKKDDTLIKEENTKKRDTEKKVRKIEKEN